MYIAVELCNKNPLSTQKGSKFATGKPHERSKTTPKMAKTRFYDTVFWSKTCTSTFTLCDHFFKNVCQLFFPKCKNIFHIVNFFLCMSKIFFTLDDNFRWHTSMTTFDHACQLLMSHFDIQLRIDDNFLWCTLSIMHVRNIFTHVTTFRHAHFHTDVK